MVMAMDTMRVMEAQTTDMTHTANNTTPTTTHMTTHMITHTITHMTTHMTTHTITPTITPTITHMTIHTPNTMMTNMNIKAIKKMTMLIIMKEDTTDRLRLNDIVLSLLFTKNITSLSN